jgi:hypothetical protein
MTTRKPASRKPRYGVNVALLNPLAIAKNGSGVEFAIYDGKRRIGTIQIGRGSFRWAGRKEDFTEMRWPEFASFMRGA